MAAIFWPNLRRLWLKTNPIDGEPNWGHAIAVPFISLWYLYANRDQLLSAKVRPSWLGLLFLLLGIGIWEYGIFPGRNDFTSDFGMVVTLFGVVALLCGWQVMKVAWFPIWFLVCALPWPLKVYDMVAFPLQKLAARVAVFTLSITGVESWHNDATKIFMTGHDGAVRTLNVAEACAGMRSLMTFIAVAAAVAFLSARPLWQKLIITASAIPIAIACNVMRVAGQGVLDYYWSQKVSEGFAHQFVGLIMMVPAFFLILLVGFILDNLFIEEATNKPAAKIVARQTGPQLAMAGGTSDSSAVRPQSQPKPRTQPAAPKPQVAPPPPSGVSLRSRAASQNRRPPGASTGEKQ